MAENFLAVTQQVLSLFLMIAVGFICGKTKLITENATTGISNIILYVSTPAAILQAFVTEQKTYEKSINLALVAAFAIFAHIIGILLAKLFIHNKSQDTEFVLRFATVFSNCGYMSFPLQKALLGDIGIFYGAMYVAVFNIFMWSYGAYLMGNGKAFSLKKCLLNPSVIATLISVILYFIRLKLPFVVTTAVNALSALNTPLPMIIIGYYLSTSSLLKALTDKRIYISAVVRLTVIPAILLTLMLILNIRGVPLIACTIAASAPAAAATTMFSIKYNRDTTCSVNSVTLTTLLSVITMPLFIAIEQIF